MSYDSSKYGFTKIRTGEVDNLSISWDYEADPMDRNGRTAVLLYVPWTESTDHHHISLNRDEAKALRDWLDAFLADV